VGELRVDGDELVLELSTLEKAEAMRSNPRAPLSSIHGVDVIDDAHAWTGVGVGFRIGMRLPGSATVATVHREGEKVFVAVHKDTPRAVRVQFTNDPWDVWIVGCADPESVAASVPTPT
jgi:hypothetical protein